MRIQIKTQENRINELYQQIIQLIDEMKRNNSRNKISEVQNLQKEHWKLIMQRDIPEISEAKRDELLRYMAEYVPLGKNKGFFNEENILDVLQQLTKGNTFFKLVDLEDRESEYGAWEGIRGAGTYKFNPEVTGAYLRHVVFHELTHCVTPNLGGLGKYKPQARKFRIEKKGKKEKENEPKNENVETRDIISSNFGAIIRELMAEFVACELSGGYKERTRVRRDSEITSDWWTLYNRMYQQVGDEFLQTLPFINQNDMFTDRDRFRVLTQIALNPNNRLAEMIISAYEEKGGQNGIEDLSRISKTFEPIYQNPRANEQQFSAIRTALLPYMPEKNITEEVTVDRRIHIQKGIHTNPLSESAIEATNQQTTTEEIEGTATKRLRIAVPKRESTDTEEVTDDGRIHIQKGLYTNPLLASAIDATEQQTTTGEIERTATKRLRIAVPKRENPDKDKTK